MNNTPYAGSPSAPKKPEPQPKPEPLSRGKQWAILIGFSVVLLIVVGLVAYVFEKKDWHVHISNNVTFVVCGVLLVWGYSRLRKAQRRK